MYISPINNSNYNYNKNYGMNFKHTAGLCCKNTLPKNIKRNIQMPDVSEIINKIIKEFLHYSEYSTINPDTGNDEFNPNRYLKLYDTAGKKGLREVVINTDLEPIAFKKKDKSRQYKYSLFIANDNFKQLNYKNNKYIIQNGNVIAYTQNQGLQTIYYSCDEGNTKNGHIVRYIEKDNYGNVIQDIKF